MSDYPLLEPIPHPVYFVRNDPELCKTLSQVSTMPTFEQFYRPEAGGASSWIVQTFLQLKLRGLNVHLVPQFLPGQICVAAREELLKLIKQPSLRSLLFRSYVIVCQQDRPRPEICEHRIVQNPLNVLGANDHLIPHWPQPGMLKRDLSRENLVENLVFKGRWYYMPDPFKNEDFINRLQQLGFNFAVGSDYAVNLADWQDYSSADVLLAIRPQRGDQYLTGKPPTKLINAWMAGCPALLGPEPAFQNLRQSELDYVEVHTPEDVIAALQRLRSQPGLYRAMVENGWKRAKEFDCDAIAQQWREVLAHSIASGYTEWLKESPVRKAFGRPVQFCSRFVVQIQEFRRFYDKP